MVVGQLYTRASSAMSSMNSVATVASTIRSDVMFRSDRQLQRAVDAPCVAAIPAVVRSPVEAKAGTRDVEQELVAISRCFVLEMSGPQRLGSCVAFS